MITLKNIVKEYRVGNNKILALNRINLEFYDSQFICIHGPSGCGKTTLLNIIGGLDRYTSGQLIINGQVTSNFKDEDWDAYRNQNIGFVFQNYYLLPQLTVKENVEIALTLVGTPKEIRNEKVEKALLTVGLSKEANKYPNELSGGQIQRVAIARAIINDPDIILADEPTGALDTKNAAIIMGILKEISKSKLVVVVSHNYELSKKYATRIIEMIDGNIISDSFTNQEQVEMKIYSQKKVSMPFWSTFSLSIKNLLRTKIRTPLTIFAGCIGMIGIGLVLSISEGVNNYIIEAQKTALVNYPIYIMSSVKPIDQEPVEREAFPDNNIVNILVNPYEEVHVNAMDTKYLDYINSMDPSLYSAINFNKTTPLFLLSKMGTEYKRVTQSYFFELIENQEFVTNQYDVLAGKYPKEANEVALLIDRYNSIDATFLNYLKIEYEGIESYTFEDLLNKEFKWISNNQIYEKTNDIYVQKGASSYSEMYNNSDMSINIVGIMRIKKDARVEIYPKGLLYTPKLTEYVVNKANESEIVKEQLAYGLTKNVFTASPFEDYETLTYKMTAQYQYEEKLYNLNALPKTSGVSIYTTSYEKRSQIETYINNYDLSDSYLNVSYMDRITSIFSDFEQIARVFSSVLIIFSSISLVVSTILIGILTYVSVNERTKEIGLLRSIGARKKDITILFNFETIIIGFFSGILGIVGVLLLQKPVNNFVQNMIQEYTYSFSGVSKVIVSEFELKYALILIIASMILTLIGGFIPAKIASRKAPIDALRTER